MRPTDLGFRSPKDRTPAAYYPRTTADGRSLSVPPKRQKTTLPQSKRFAYYNDHARKTGFRVGPGLYKLDNFDISRSRIPGTPVYRDNHGCKDYSTNAYYYAGNHIIFDPYLLSKTKQNERSALTELSQTLSERILTRPTTASSNRKGDVPWFLKTYTRTKTESRLNKSGSVRKHTKSPFPSDRLRSRISRAVPQKLTFT